MIKFMQYFILISFAFTFKLEAVKASNSSYYETKKYTLSKIPKKYEIYKEKDAPKNSIKKNDIKNSYGNLKN